MRLLGTLDHKADVSTTYPMLSQVGIIHPEFMMNITNLFEGGDTAFSSFMGRKGLGITKLYSGMDDGAFKVIGNKQIKWGLEGYPFRKGRVVTAPVSSTPGVGMETFTVDLDIDWFSVNDDLELGDRFTTIHVLDKQRAGTNKYTYTFRINDNNLSAFVDPTLLAVGCEVAYLHNSFPELSEDGAEKHTFPEWHTNTMTIQRMKYSISGTARHTKLLFEHQGQKYWDTAANLGMMKRWAISMENQFLFGKSTVDANGKCYQFDTQGREIIAGDGLIAQGDSSLKYTYNQLTTKVLDSILSNMQGMQTSTGLLEVMMICGSQFEWEWQQLMRDTYQQSPQVLFVKGSDGNLTETNFTSYRVGSVKLSLVRSMAFDAPWRANIRNPYDGTFLSSSNAYFVSLGNTAGNDPNISLLTLGNEEGDRRFVKRIINGMAGPGEKSASGKVELAAASPVDGMQVHQLSECGLVLRNPLGFAELRKARRA